MLNFKPLICKPSTRLAMSTWFLSLLLLAACGGGSTGGAVVEETTASTPAPTPPAPATPLISPGAYVASLNGKDWVAMLLPTTQGSGTVTNFYGLYYKNKDITQVPNLYSGSGLFTNVNSASFTRLSVYSNTSAVLQTGSGTLSLSEVNGLVEAKLRFPDAGSNDRTVSAGAPSNATYNTSGNLNSVNGSWKGRWSYGVSPADEFPLYISAQGDISTSQTFQQYCRLTEGKLAPSAYSSNLLTFTLKIPDATQCLLGNQTLNGAAFVTASPVAGKTQRLYIAGVTTDGRGISYIADR